MGAGPAALDRVLANNATRLALYIAVGIGLHNFAEGLAIGQSAASGDISLAVFLSSRLGRRITDPILQLARTAQIIGEMKDYSVRATVSSPGDEVGSLTESFNEMLGRIEQQKRDAVKQQRQHQVGETIRMRQGKDTNVRPRGAQPHRAYDVVRVSLQLRGDVGGFGVASHLTWQVFPYVSWRVAKVISLQAGYRVLSASTAGEASLELAKWSTSALRDAAAAPGRRWPVR